MATNPYSFNHFITRTAPATSLTTTWYRPGGQAEASTVIDVLVYRPVLTIRHMASRTWMVVGPGVFY